MLLESKVLLLPILNANFSNLVCLIKSSSRRNNISDTEATLSDEDEKDDDADSVSLSRCNQIGILVTVYAGLTMPGEG